MGPGAQGCSVTVEEPELSREHPLILRDRGDVEEDVNPLMMVCYGTVSKGLYEKDEERQESMGVQCGSNSFD